MKCGCRKFAVCAVHLGLLKPQSEPVYACTVDESCGARE